jgi:DNA-binding Lrp family transcriptional regulator
MPKTHGIDQIDARLLLALTRSPRATTIALADAVGLSRNTVQARLSKFESADVLRSFERLIDPAVLGYPMQAFIFTRVTQRKLADVAADLADVPEVLEVSGLSGVTDLLIRVVAQDADDLYRIAGQILGIDGVKRTTSALVMRELLDYRIEPLIAKLAHRRT